MFIWRRDGFASMDTDGALYAFGVTPEKSGANHGYVAAGGPGLTGPTDTEGIRAYQPPRGAESDRQGRVRPGTEDSLEETRAGPVRKGGFPGRNPGRIGSQRGIPWKKTEGPVQKRGFLEDNRGGLLNRLVNLATVTPV